jgi:Elongation factor Tu GTP binding domain
MQRMHQQLLHLLQPLTPTWQSQTSSKHMNSHMTMTQPCEMGMTPPLVSYLQSMAARIQRLLCTATSLTVVVRAARRWCCRRKWVRSKTSCNTTFDHEACACFDTPRIQACLLCAAVQSATEQLAHMAVDDRPSALTPPVLDSSASGAPQPAQPPPTPAPAGDTALPSSQADGSELTSEQQSVVTALAEMDSRCFCMFRCHLQLCASQSFAATACITLASTCSVDAFRMWATPECREHVNVVFIGHVDAGKSTIGGQILFLTGGVDERTIQKYERCAPSP